MISPRVSVIIPTFNQANYLAEAVQSILDQTYHNLEVIVVDDASTDHTGEVMRQFDDHRIKYIVHRENRYAAAARNTGIRASSGDLVAFLDADDRAHPEKIKVQVAFLDGHPEIGLAYNSRIEMDESGLPLSIVQSSPVVTLSDLVMDYPFAPSEVLLRKEWAFRVGLFDESYLFHGEDPDFHMRLALKGCNFAGVARVLTFRRLHAGRAYSNITGVIDDHIRAFEKTFADPRCPPEVLALREKSLGKISRILSSVAFFQHETMLGQQLIRQSIRFDRSILDVEASKYRDFIIRTGIRDGGDHEQHIRGVFAQLPPELEWITQFAESAVAFGFLLRGARDIMWGRIEQGAENFDKGIGMGAQPDELFLRFMTAKLLVYEEQFGYDAAQTVLRNMSPYLEKAGDRANMRLLRAYYSVHRGFKYYRAGEYPEVAVHIIQALLSNPKFFFNRGVLAVLSRSLLRSVLPSMRA